MKSPFQGLFKQILRRFEPEDSDRFFGRDQFLSNLVNELEQTNLLLLLGASCSGKSSIIRTGLVPWLQKKWGNHFASLILAPDHDSFESCFSSLLAGRYKQSEAQIAKTGDPDTLSQVVKQLKPLDTFWLITKGKPPTLPYTLIASFLT